jgi:hypothetical protein
MALNHPQLAYRNIISKLPGAPGIDREIALSGSGSPPVQMAQRS